VFAFRRGAVGVAVPDLRRAVSVRRAVTVRLGAARCARHWSCRSWFTLCRFSSSVPRPCLAVAVRTGAAYRARRCLSFLIYSVRSSPFVVPWPYVAVAVRRGAARRARRWLSSFARLHSDSIGTDDDPARVGGGICVISLRAFAFSNLKSQTRNAASLLPSTLSLFQFPFSATRRNQIGRGLENFCGLAKVTVYFGE
jgi:hypothetical protein